jgi:hypothetical protein
MSRCFGVLLVAWVVWKYSLFQTKDMDSWASIGSAATLEECKRTAMTAADNAAHQFRAQKDGAIVRQMGLVIDVRLASGQKGFHMFGCLPDTIDPRRPKAR